MHGLCRRRLGFAGAILNPFTIGIAQGLAGIPLFSGIEYRIFCWVVINLIGFAWILRYAAKVRKDPKSSPVYEEDQYWRDLHGNNSPDVSYHTPRAAWISFGLLATVQIIFAAYYPTTTLQIGNSVIKGLPLLPVLTAAFILTSLFTLRKTVHLYILNLLFFTIFYLITGVMGYGWYIMEIATLFFALGLAAGIANNRTPNELVKLFLDGCKDIMSAALVVGLAGGIIVILKDGLVIDTILYNLAKGMEGLGQVATGRHDVRDPDADQPDHSFRKCQSGPDHADHGSLLRLDRIVKASDRDGFPVRRRIHQYDHPDIGSADRRSGCQPHPLR